MRKNDSRRDAGTERKRAVQSASSGHQTKTPFTVALASDILSPSAPLSLRARFLRHGYGLGIVAPSFAFVASRRLMNATQFAVTLERLRISLGPVPWQRLVEVSSAMIRRIEVRPCRWRCDGDDSRLGRDVEASVGRRRARVAVARG